MKKFKLIALSLLASTFGLASCELPAAVKKIIPWADKEKEEQKDEEQESKGEVLSVKIKNEVSKITDETEPFKLIAHVEVKDNASKEVTWSSSAEAVATVGADGLVTPKGAGSVTFTATSVADPSKKDSITIEVVVVPGVASVEISGKPDIAYLHRSSSLTATVHGKGQYSTGVTWASSNEEVAKVDDNGVVSYLSVGEATITATSKFDKSKYAVVSLSVVDGGLHPEYIAEGYAYSKDLPVSTINSYSGTVASFPSFDTEEGFYIVAGSTSGGNNYLNLVFDATYDNYNAASDALDAGEYYYFMDRYYELDCFMDPEQLLEVDFSLDESPDGYDMISFSFYHAADIFKGSKDDTTDEAWNESVSAILTELNIDLPFVKLGANYAGEQDDYSIEISDKSADFNKLNGYDEVLNAAGFAVDEEGVYSKAIDSYSYVEVEFGFTEVGNTIIASKKLTELDAFPEAEVAAFVGEEGIGSKYSVPTFSGEGLKFTFDSYQIALDEEETDIRDAIEVGVLYVSSEEQCTSYVGSLLADGYILDGSEEKYYGSTYAFLHKGKICVQATINYLTRSATDEEIAEFEAITEEDIAAMTDDEYNDWLTKALELAFTGTFTVYDYTQVESASLLIYGDPEGIEDPGVYILESEVKVAIDSTYTIEPFYWEVDAEEHPVSFESSNPEVATVDANGVITPVALGDVTITMTAADSEYSDELLVHVTNPASINDVLPGANEWLAEQGALEELVLPEIDNLEAIEGFYDDEYECYSIVATISGDQEEAVFAYANKLDPNVFEVTDKSAEGYGIIAATEEVEMQIWYWTDGTFNIDIYYSAGSIGEDSVVFAEAGFDDKEVVDEVTLGNGTVIEFDKGGASTSPTYYENGEALRVYAKSTITVTAPEGEKLESVTLTYTGSLTVTASTGSVSNGVWTAPSGGAQSVTFTIGASSTSGHLKITEIAVTLVE